VKQAAQKGEWVCLKNLHLVTPWLPVLEKEFKLLNPHQRFRLWLTSEPHAKFPAILLQSSLKITYETPPGVKNNLQRTYQYVAPSGPADGLKQQLLFTLAWFHALIQERRTYIPQGWSKYYEFSYGDLKAGEQVMGTIRDEAGGGLPQWQKVYGLLENAIYGGRIDNDFDMRVLRAYMESIFRDDVMKGSKKLSDAVQVPNSQNIRDFTAVINQLPETDSPQLFGLPTNIDRSVQRFNSQQVVHSLKSLAAVSAEELRFDKEKWSQLLGPVCQLWATAYRPEEFSSIKIHPAKLGSEDPLESFVYMEMQGVIEILHRVHEGIDYIHKVLMGTEMLTSATEAEAKALLKGEVPHDWQALWEGPDNPSQWIRAVTKKAHALKDWL